MGLIEEGLVSNQFNSSITLLVLFLLQNHQHSILVTKYSLFLEFFVVVFQVVLLEKLKSLHSWIVGPPLPPPPKKGVGVG